jgi:hypothetical protein
MPCSDPIIAMLEPFRPLFDSPNLEENADPLERNSPGKRTANSDGCLVANRPRPGSALKPLSPGPQSCVLVSAGGKPTLNLTDLGNLCPGRRDTGYRD